MCPGVGFDVVPRLPRGAAQGGAARRDASRARLRQPQCTEPGHRQDHDREACARAAACAWTAGSYRFRFASRVREIDFGEGSEDRHRDSLGRCEHGVSHHRHPQHRGLSSPHRRGTVRRMQRLNRWRWLAGVSAGPVAGSSDASPAAPPGPDAQQRERTPVLVWGEARNAAGRTVAGRMRVRQRLHGDGACVARHRGPGPEGATERGFSHSLADRGSGFRGASARIDARRASQRLTLRLSVPTRSARPMHRTRRRAGIHRAGSVG